jgi:glycosyltransferase involved in cell wall biosynthesis
VFAAAGLPLPPGVRWLGVVSDAALRALYENAAAFVVPSRYEGFGLPPLEAMACGTPVIASCVTAMPEVLGSAAELVEPTEVGAIFEALRRVLTQAELADEMRTIGRVHARRHTWKETAKRTLQAYQQALGPQDERPIVRRAL